MKIGCYCGATIYDQSDSLPHKGHFIPDQKWLAAYDAIDEDVIDPLLDGSLEREAAYIKSRGIISGSSRLIYQCRSCGRLYVEDGNRQLHCYVPASSETAKEILRG